jgi:hypothetical protein
LVISAILLGMLPVNEQFPKDSLAKIIQMCERRGSRSGRETNDHLPRVFDFVSSLGMLSFSWLLPKSKCSTFGKRPNSVGIGPDNLDPCKYRNFIASKFPSSVGMDPSNKRS